MRLARLFVAVVFVLGGVLASSLPSSTGIAHASSPAARAAQDGNYMPGGNYPTPSIRLSFVRCQAAALS